MKNPLMALNELGQSAWYDFITRDLISSGKLARLIKQDGLSGMTSNPTIFEKAIASSRDYDDDIRLLAAQGLDPSAIFESIAVADVQSACDAFLPTFRDAGGKDGFASLEVSPTLARDTNETVGQAQRLWEAIDRPNAMIKIPGTVEGLAAIRAATANGVNVNVTLLFSVDRYRQVIDAFLSGLEARVAKGQPIDQISSVASFFVSRVDTKLDPVLDQKGLSELRGKIAIANAAAAYRAFTESLATDRWRALAAKGANAQRPLWASTSTKDPKLPDVYYVEALIADQTVNTMPPDTFEAYRDHGKPMIRIPDAIATADERLGAIAKAGIDLDRATKELEDDGIAKFAASFQSLLSQIEAKVGTLANR
jgi:transaldolase/transaldolase/glucose-6-phosphate isomerase